MLKVAVVVGSLRQDSINRKLARALAKFAAKDCEFTWCKLDDVPMYNGDLEAEPPAPVSRLRDEVKAADAILFVTPEYNRSLPAVLKNALDWVSRPYGQNKWAGKPAAVVGASPGAIGTAVAQAEFRSIATILSLAVMGAPEAYLAFKEGLVDPDANVTDEGTRKFLQGFMDSFVAWVKRHRAAS